MKAVTERPIIMSGEMVRAILEGRKTMTRRVIKPQPAFLQQLRDGRFETSPDGGFDWGINYIKCPYGRVGDRFWVRETYRLPDWLDVDNTSSEYASVVQYKAGKMAEFTDPVMGKWHPSIFMPRWASRINLEITELRVERVQDITQNNARLEGSIFFFLPKDGYKKLSETGCEFSGDNVPIERRDYVKGFQILWDSINAKRGYGWEVNPWCWCISFQSIDK